VYVWVVDVSRVLSVSTSAAWSGVGVFVTRGLGWGRKGVRTLSVHAAFYCVFIVGFRGVFECFAQALRGGCFCVLERVHVWCWWRLECAMERIAPRSGTEDVVGAGVKCGLRQRQQRAGKDVCRRSG
jgi:hypothetical protein